MERGYVGAIMVQLCGVAHLVVWVGKRVKVGGKCVWCGVGGASVEALQD